MVVRVGHSGSLRVRVNMKMLLDPISLIDRAENIVLMLISWWVKVAAILGNLLVIRVFVVTLVDLLHHFAST